MCVTFPPDFRARAHAPHKNAATQNAVRATQPHGGGHHVASAQQLTPVAREPRPAPPCHAAPAFLAQPPSLSGAPRRDAQEHEEQAHRRWQQRRQGQGQGRPGQHQRQGPRPRGGRVPGQGHPGVAARVRAAGKAAPALHQRGQPPAVLQRPPALLPRRAAQREAVSVRAEAPHVQLHVRLHGGGAARPGERDEAPDAAGAGGLRQQRDGQVHGGRVRGHCLHAAAQPVPHAAARAEP